MKKGFTLVELIGVMVILGLMVLVGVPAMTRTLRNTNEDEYNRALTDLYLATENYIEVNRSNFPTLNEAGGETYISLNELKNAGYLRANITNPKTEKVFDYTKAVRVFRNLDGTLDYEYNTNYYGVDGYTSDGLIVHYDALNNNGIGSYDANTSTWKDLSGNNNDGTIKGATFTKNNIFYDGVNDYTIINNSKTFDFSNGQTLEIKVSVDKLDLNYLLGNWQDAGGGIMIDSSSNFRYEQYLNDSYKGVSAQADFGFKTIAATYDGTSLKLYVNGELLNTISNPGTIASSTAPIAIGANPNSNGFDRFSEINVQCVRIYNKTLDDDEIRHNYEIDQIRYYNINSTEQSEEEKNIEIITEYNNTVNNICSNAKKYIYDNISNFPTLSTNGGETYISLNELKNAGYIEGNIVNSKINDVFNYATAIKITKNSNSTLTCEYNTNYYGVDGYTSDGLIVHFDALNNNGIGKYSSSTTTWKDLSGNNNDGIIYNATWNSNNLSFDGDNDYIDMSNKLNDLFKSGMTLELIIKFDQNSDRAILLGNYNNSNSINIEQYTTSQGLIWYNNKAAFYQTSDGFHEFGSLKNYSYLLNKSNNTFYFYKNSEEKFSTTNSAFAENSINFTNAKIGKDNRSTPDDTYLEGEIYAIRIYNRALTETEIKHNYEIDKLRFNIN